MNLWGWHTLGLVPAALLVIAFIVMMSAQDEGRVALAVIGVTAAVLGGLAWFTSGIA